MAKALKPEVKKAILEALPKLRPDQKEDWTGNGLPKLARLCALTGLDDIVREEVYEVAPDFTQTNPVIPAQTADDPPPPTESEDGDPLPVLPNKADELAKKGSEMLDDPKQKEIDAAPKGDASTEMVNDLNNDALREAHLQVAKFEGMIAENKKAIKSKEEDNDFLERKLQELRDKIAKKFPQKTQAQLIREMNHKNHQDRMQRASGFKRLQELTGGAPVSPIAPVDHRPRQPNRQQATPLKKAAE